MSDDLTFYIYFNEMLGRFVSDELFWSLQIRNGSFTNTGFGGAVTCVGDRVAELLHLSVSS